MRKINKYIIIIMVYFLLPYVKHTIVFASDAIKIDNIKSCYSDTEKYECELAYRLVYPANYNSDYKYPLVIFLNDKEYRGSDNESQLREPLKIDSQS